MSKLITAVLGGAMCLIGTSVFADTYRDVQAPNASVSLGDPYIGVFNLHSPGNDGTTSISPTGYPTGNGTFTDEGGYALHTPLSDATATFYLFDNHAFIGDAIFIDLGLFDATGGVEGSRSWHATFDIDGTSGTLDVLEHFGGIVYTVGGGDILGGSMTLKYAMLTADSADPVPDGGMTMSLLGLGLVGIWALGYKIRSRRR